MAKEEVQSRWQGIKPDFSASRPDKGWDAHANQYIAKKVQSEEASTGKGIATVDRYCGAGWIVVTVLLLVFLRLG